MDFPMAVKEQIEQKAGCRKLPELKAASAGITKRYLEESGRGKRLVTSELDALVYAAVRMPATFAAVSKALQDSPAQRMEIHSLLDVGAGTGAAAWAVSMQLKELKEILCLERESAMRKLGRELMQTGDTVLQRAIWKESDIKDDAFPYHADLVTASYVLNELSEQDRITALRKLWKAADVMLLLTEPGTPEGFSQLMKARKLLLQEGASIAAPCPHGERCRLTAEDWCHFTVRVPRSKLHKLLKGGEVPYEDEKFCFMAFVREPAEKVEARILRHPVIEKGRITLSLCTPQENKMITVTKKQGELFRIARKAQSGQAWNEKKID